MATSDLPMIIAAPGYRNRADRLTAELRVALIAVDRHQLLNWATDATRMTGHVFVRRGVRLGKVIARVGRGTLAEAENALDAARNGRLTEHSKERGQALLDTAKDASKRMGRQVTALGAMARNPEQLPEAVVTVMAALVSSGGLDGNGGIPDLDLQFGIGAHRSIFTHSIIAGSVAEGSLYAVATLVGLTHRHLPAPHDPLWDAIDRNRDRFLTAITAGISAGIAYHLLIDGTLQPGTYHDLPVHMPIAGHEALLDANAAAEAVDIPAKKDTFRHARDQNG
jgi:hypothetical protein